MKRTRSQSPRQQDPTAATSAGAGKPQRRAKQPRQPKAGGKKTDRSAAAAASKTTAASGGAASAGAELAPCVPDVCARGDEVAAAAQTAAWDLDGGLSAAGSWWTFGVEEEKLLGWFPFVEEDFPCLGAGRGDAEAAAAVFDDDIWRIHQIYEIPHYAAK